MTLPSNPSGQLQTLQTPPISPKGTGAPSFFVNNNPVSSEGALQQEEKEDVFDSNQQEDPEDEEEEYEEEEGELTSFSEDLEQLMTNHQLNMPEELFNNGAFMQNLTAFLQGYNIRPSKKTLIYPRPEQEPAIHIPVQVTKKEEPVRQKEEQGIGQTREKFRVVDSKKIGSNDQMDGARKGFRSEKTKLKKKYQPGAQTQINSVRFSNLDSD